MQIQVKDLKLASSHSWLFAVEEWLLDRAQSPALGWLQTKYLRVESRSLVFWSWTRFDPSSIIGITQLFSFLACKKSFAFSNFHMAFSSLLMFLSFFFFLIQASCLHEELLFLVLFSSPLMLLFELAASWKRNTITPSLPTHLCCVVCQQGRAASILLLANCYCSQFCLFTINFPKQHLFSIEHILPLTKW